MCLGDNLGGKREREREREINSLENCFEFPKIVFFFFLNLGVVDTAFCTY